MKTLTIAAVLISVAAVQPALAQGTEEQRSACSGDAFRLCASSIPNVGKIAACMREKRAQLSPGCRTVMDASDGSSRTVATAPAPRLADRPKPVERVAAARKPAPLARETARQRPVASLRLAQREDTARSAPQARAAERRITPRPVRIAEARQTPRPASVRNSIPRRTQVARAQASDYAQADYWMRRVTGFGLPVESASLAGLGTLLR